MPTKTGYSAVDNSAGAFAALGLLAQVHAGTGGQVDVAMYDVMLSQLNYVASSALNGGDAPRRHACSAHPYFVPAQVFRTRDAWIVLFVTHDRFWQAFAREVGRPDWLDDPVFATMDARSRHRERVIAAVAEVLLQRDTAEWLGRLLPLGLVLGEIETLEAALASDQTAARGMVVEVPSEAGPITLIGNPVKIDGVRERYLAPPSLGEHNETVLSPISAA